MKPLLVMLAVIVTASGCPRTLSDADRAALQDFRAVERDCLARETDILRDESVRMTYPDDLAAKATEQLVVPWQKMRARLKLEERKLGDELAKDLRRYLDERELAWTALAKALANQWTTPTENHRWKYRESDDAADKDQKIIERRLASLKLAALPPVTAPPIVELARPPVNTTPGAAYFLSNRSVIRLDDNGFRIIATDVDSMDVLPDGTMWACSIWHIAYWDGARTTDFKPKLPSGLCAAAPNGDLWVVQDRYYDNTHDLLGRFDRKTWKIVPAHIGDPEENTEHIVVDREGRLYVQAQTGGMGDHIYTLDKTWQNVPLERAGEHPRIESLTRGTDGHAWVTYGVEDAQNIETGIARLSSSTTERLQVPAATIYPDDVIPFIDAAGVATVVQPRTNLLVQGTKTRLLPMPAPRRNLGAPLAIDGAGRIWIDLADGINVIEGDKRTVYPRGSIEGIVENVRAIVVTGAGPTLARPLAVTTRTIKGQIRSAGKVELAMCGESYSGECPPGLPTWKTYSDAEGYFTFENVPRWSMEILGLSGLSGNKYWRTIQAKCCAESDDLGEVAFEPGAIY